jgi:asparagine synthase (glutamine-hydrolysing)
MSLSINWIRLEFGPNATCFRGDGGDKIFPALRTQSFSNNSSVVDYLLDDQSIFSLETASALTGVNADRIRESIRERIDSYPNSDADMSYSQFLFHERGPKFIYNGEDRARYHTWCAAPLYSLPVVDYAMRIPHKQKKHNRLYRKTLENLNNDVVDIEYANFGAPINSAEYRVKQSIYNLMSMFPQTRDFLIGLLRGSRTSQYDESISKVLMQQANSTTDLTPIEKRQVEDIASSRDKYEDMAVYNLLTVTLAAERLNQEDSLSDFQHLEFSGA